MGLMRQNIQHFHGIQDVSQLLGHLIWKCFDHAQGNSEQLNDLRPMWSTCYQLVTGLHLYTTSQIPVYERDVQTQRQLKLYMDMMALQCIYRMVYPFSGYWDNGSTATNTSAGTRNTAAAPPDEAPTRWRGAKWTIQVMAASPSAWTPELLRSAMDDNDQPAAPSVWPSGPGRTAEHRAYGNALYILATFESLMKYVEVQQRTRALPDTQAPYLPRGFVPYRLVSHFYCPTMQIWGDMEEIYLKALMDPTSLRQIPPLLTFVRAVQRLDFFNQWRALLRVRHLGEYDALVKQAAQYLKQVVPTIDAFIQQVVLSPHVNSPLAFEFVVR